jgi:glycosyltransferase involved in cell wall biosynthesis
MPGCSASCDQETPYFVTQIVDADPPRWLGASMKILFATDHIHFPQGGGGAERNTHELCLALRQRGVEPGVMSSLSANQSWLSWSNRLRRTLPPRHRYPRDTQCGYPVYRGWASSGASEVVKRFRPSVVVVQSTHPDNLLRQFGEQGVPLAAYFHEVVEIDHLASLAGRNIRIIANSPFTAARLRARCGLEPVVVLPLIDPAHYVTATRPERVLFINTVPRKGLDIAFALAEARPDISFDFVRSWILDDRQVAELDCRAAAAGNITIHPPLRDMRPLYARAKLVLAPSQWEETWGRVATEAHICSCATLSAAMRDFIGNFCSNYVIAERSPCAD